MNEEKNINLYSLKIKNLNLTCEAGRQTGEASY